MLRDWIIEQLDSYAGMNIDELLDARYNRFRNLGSYIERSEETTAASE